MCCPSRGSPTPGVRSRVESGVDPPRFGREVEKQISRISFARGFAPGLNLELVRPDFGREVEKQISRISFGRGVVPGLNLELVSPDFGREVEKEISRISFARGFAPGLNLELARREKVVVWGVGLDLTPQRRRSARSPSPGGSLQPDPPNNYFFR